MPKLFCALVIFAVGLVAVKADGESRVIGGQNAVRGQFPHHVQIRNINWNLTRPHCTGSIIAERFVLTAAACTRFPTNVTSDLRVIVDQVDLQANSKQYLVDKAIIHPEFNIFFDIAVLRVAEPFKFSANVRPVQLPTADTPMEGSTLPATTVGYGQFKTGDDDDEANFPRILQWMNVTAVSRSECGRMFAGDPGGAFLRSDHICAKTAPGAALCRYDHGGGLITNGSRPVILGVFSLRWHGCPSRRPPVYTRVFSFLDFVRSAMQQ